MADPSSAVIGAHIHAPATTKENAPIVLDLAITSDITKSPIKGSAIIDQFLLSQMLEGLSYTNIHTENFPAGEIRGQNTIKEINENFVKFRTILRGRNEVPSVTASFQGDGQYVLNVEDGSISWNVNYGDTQFQIRDELPDEFRPLYAKEFS